MFVELCQVLWWWEEGEDALLYLMYAGSMDAANEMLAIVFLYH